MLNRMMFGAPKLTISDTVIMTQAQKITTEDGGFYQFYRVYEGAFPTKWTSSSTAFGGSFSPEYIKVDDTKYQLYAVYYNVLLNQAEGLDSQPYDSTIYVYFYGDVPPYEYCELIIDDGEATSNSNGTYFLSKKTLLGWRQTDNSGSRPFKENRTYKLTLNFY